MSSVAICAICFDDARPTVDYLQSISACGHVFHERCLQHWIMEYCPAGRDPTCPSCKRPAYNVHRLYFQSVESDSTQPQVSPSRNLQAAVEDPKNVNCLSAFRQLERSLAAAKTFVYEQHKELESQFAAAAAALLARSELAQCSQGLASIQEEQPLQREKVQEESRAMAKVLVSIEEARRILPVLLQDRENLEARVKESVEFAGRLHDLLTSSGGMNSFKV